MVTVSKEIGEFAYQHIETFHANFKEPGTIVVVRSMLDKPPHPLTLSPPTRSVASRRTASAYGKSREGEPESAV